jgi:predicted methyltransferase
MKNMILSFLFLLIVSSCTNTEKLTELENRIAKIENQNKVLVDSLNSVNAEFIKPFKIYEKIVLSELENSPNQIISDYEFLIKDYPNSFWRHEAKKRIENVEKRKKYWSEKDGWKLPEKPKKTELIEIIEPMVISCPGC